MAHDTRPDLSRHTGENDATYRVRLLRAIGAQDNFARDACFAVHGKCLDSFAGSVAHAIFIGWRGAAGKPTAHHKPDCGCAKFEVRRA